MNFKMLKVVIASLIISVSSFANADLINVSYLEITNAKGDWLQVGEVIANDMFNNDVALSGFQLQLHHISGQQLVDRRKP
jgi:hypothetical protein